MKRIAIAGMLITATLSASATTLYEQLCEFNFNWKKYSMLAPKGDARSFKTDADYVQTHLSCVIPILKSNPTDQFTSDQSTTRLRMIELLDGYRAAKLFPLNHYRTERIPVFIDEHGTHCAVGYLMMKSGYEELAQRISRTDNYVWVKDLKDPEALVWQQYSGFTLEELKLIQGAYDYYPPFAWTSPDKYETPQMPICTTAYFDKELATLGQKKEDLIWCKGGGNGKVINGDWEQNYAPGKPWIKGHFINGQRSGDWEEYYPGTTTLCRTESWRNNKLNGVRKRFDRQSRLIEEIIFVEGVAVCKTNYELYDSLAYVRIPVNDSIVNTQVFNNQGKLIACGKERIYNPSGLLWFQNIELTALNSMQVSARSTQMAMGTSNQVSFGQDGGYNTGGSSQSISLQSLFHGGGGFQPSLVEYHKIGTWWYYPEASERYARTHSKEWYLKYQHFGTSIYYATAMFADAQKGSNYDSLKVDYVDNSLTQFKGFSNNGNKTFKFEYYDLNEYYGFDVYNSANIVTIWNQPYVNNQTTSNKKLAGQYNENGERIGEWYYYSTAGTMIKKEQYLQPFKEEKELMLKPTAGI